MSNKKVTTTPSANNTVANKASRRKRHIKLNPNDRQATSTTYKPAIAGRPHAKRTPLEAATKRAVNHELLFGVPNTRKVSGRALHTAIQRSVYLGARPSTNTPAALAA